MTLLQEDVIPTCRELGIGIVAYSPLGRGFLTGAISSADDLAPGDRRREMPRFQKEAFEKASGGAPGAAKGNAYFLL